ncbi:MAG: LptF/LptG family permease [Nitrospirae bacterium]|nr:LptF/LptG family permease [Nitrospirota bacterium]
MVENMIIRRSIFKEVLINSLIVVSFLSIVLFMEKFVRLSRIILGKGVTIADIAKIFLFLEPSILLLSIPMAILTAVFLTYGRMSADNEVVVLKASGMNLWSISRPAVTLSVIGFIILLFISVYVLPRSMQSFKKTIQESIIKRASMTFDEGAFSTVFKQTVLFVKEILPGDRFRGIFIYREGNTRTPLVIIAESGEIYSNPKEGVINLNMHNGVIHTFGEKSSSEVNFAEYSFVLISVVEDESKIKPSEIGMIDLWKQKGQSVLLDVELNRRLAIPFASLIFGFLGPALATRIGRTGRMGGFSLSLIILIS